MQESSSSGLLNFFLVIVLVWLVVIIISLLSLYKRKDLLGPVKYLWVAIIVFAPVVGLLAYLIYGPKRHTKRLE